ncbi:type II secretion system F family protein [Paenibacillus allorhizosphaerae]|nr:type II secretion system F family protein [Paenibacillus allorhizosphaerae]
MNVLLLLEVVAAGMAVMCGRRHYLDWIKGHPELFRGTAFVLLSAAALWLTDRCRLAERFTASVGKIHHLMVGLYGAKQALPYTRWFLAKMLIMMFGVFSLFTALGGAADGNAEVLVYGALIALLLPFLLYKQTFDRLKRRKQQMLIELPEIVNQLMLLIGAGETVAQALVRTVPTKEAEMTPLQKELNAAVYALKMNTSFPRVMEDFSKRCGLPEVSLFTTTLLLNYKRGGEDLIISLKELSVTLWEKRKSLARTLGEEASSKMVFPMVLIFFAVMVIIAAPALLVMN